MNVLITSDIISILAKKILRYHEKNQNHDENSFHTAIELLLEPLNYIPEVQLISVSKKEHVKYGFADILVLVLLD